MELYHELRYLVQIEEGFSKDFFNLVFLPLQFIDLIQHLRGNHVFVFDGVFLVLEKLVLVLLYISNQL